MSSPYIGPSLSAGTPFLNTLPAAISAANDNFVDPKSTSAPPPAHEQKGLSRSNAAGLKAAQSSLSAHDGGILSGLQSPASAHATVTPDTDKGPPLGPPSTDRVITRAVTLPEGALGASADTPVIAYTTATPADNQNSGSDDRATPGPETAVTTFMHFGMQPDPKYETAAPMTKRATKNIAILADAVRATETEVADLATKLGNLTVELRLGERASTAAQLLTTPPPTRSRSDSQTSQDNDISELFHRVREVKLTVSESATEGAELAEHVSALEEDLTARVSALEDRPSDGLTVSALSTAVAERFGEITTDRNALDTAMRNQFETQLKATAQLRLENKDLRKTLEAMQTTIARLELGGTTVVRAPMPAITGCSERSSAFASRPRSPPHDLPAKRRKLFGMEVFITMGPFPHSLLSPVDLFMSVLKPALPTFVFSKPFFVILDPVHPYHLHITMESAEDQKSLLAMWGTGGRTIGMRASNGDGVMLDGNDSISSRSSRPFTAQNGPYGRDARSG
ncbi:hypothetical protein B0H14DRAFT_3500879 [Mycena olivaceomarginata]|nr:hypothetical protein B0H14DRAFT_3500879 [Mycena olivaceomarginata]